MHLAGGLVLESGETEVAVAAGDLLLGYALDQGFVLAAVMDQVGDGADLEAVLVRELKQVRQPGHGPVILEDLADHRGRLHAGQLGKIATGFGVAGAHQHAAVLGHQREDVAGLDDVGRLGVLGRRRLYRARAVVRRDAGGHSLGRLYREREGGAVRAAVVPDHQRQIQLAAARFGECEADQAAAVLGHEVDGLWRDMLGGDDEVAFVLAVFLVYEYDHATGADVGDDFLDGADAHGWEC